MVTMSDIVALINSIGRDVATEVSKQYENVGIVSGSSTSTGLEFTLANNSILDIPVNNWNFITIEERNKLLKVITNGLGDMYLSNDGTYKKPTSNNVSNYNQPIIINSSDWSQDEGSNRYILTITHNLNTTNIVPAVYDNENKLEIVGFEILNKNQIKLESVSIFSGKLILNYSTTIADIPITTDATSSGYFDIGTMRMQFGTVGAVNTVTLPMPFANNTYTVITTMQGAGSCVETAVVTGKTTASFNVARYYYNGGYGTASEGFNYLCMGLKP